MDEPKSLDNLFKEKIFRIPDYQRGYAWQKSHLTAFWEDLINLSDDRSHYTGVLTLKEVKRKDVAKTDNEYWLVEDHSYKVYHIVDGQQRLATFVVFLQAFIEFVRERDENKGKSDPEIYITDDRLSLEKVISRYLYETKPAGVQDRTYKFGYTVDNPSYEYLRHKIFNEDGSPSIEETFYTLNLRIAKQYFYKQLKELYPESGMSGLQEIYKKLTKKFLFNEYVIKDEFNVFVAFETMNNRGKPLSNLELLKNRLIYLSTLYRGEELGDDDRKSLRDAINGAWKEVYKQLGRNDKRPLNDDEFLKAHWIMYFQYSRKKGNAYIKFLLDEQFSPQKVHKKIEREVALELPEEQRTDSEIDDSDSDNGSGEESNKDSKHRDVKITAQLQPYEIREYVDSLKESAGHWFNSFFPHLATGLSDAEKSALDRLNRLGMVYFRPLIMSVFKNEGSPEKRIDLFDHIERFIFIVFRLSQARSNYRDNEFYNASGKFNRGELTLEQIKERLGHHMWWMTTDGKNGTFNSKFSNYLQERFKNDGNGYYGWNGLHYFLYEYELYLRPPKRQTKVVWDALWEKDKLSIEHIFPHTLTDGWKAVLAEVDEKDYPLYRGSIGNLLLLSQSINSSLQNYDFGDKKNPKRNAEGNTIRNGYSNGSYSEMEVAQNDKWTPAEIEERGLRLLNFMETRWGIKFENDDAKKALLFLPENEN